LIVEIFIGNFLSDLHVLSPGGTEGLAYNPDRSIENYIKRKKERKSFQRFSTIFPAILWQDFYK